MHLNEELKMKIWKKKERKKENEDLGCIENTLKSTAEKLEPVNSIAPFTYKINMKRYITNILVK